MPRWIKPNTNFDFTGNFRLWGGLSLAATVATIVVIVVNIVVRGSAFNYGTDFKGGTQLQIEFSRAVGAADVRNALEHAGFDGAEVQKIDDGDRPNFFMLRLSQVVGFQPAEQAKLTKALQQSFGDKAKADYTGEADRVYLRFAKGYDVAGKGTTPTAPAASTDAKTNDEAVHSIDAATEQKIRKVFTDAGVAAHQIQIFGKPVDNVFEVTLGGMAEDVRKAFDKSFGAGSIKDIPQVESVGARAGQQLRTDALKAVMYSLLLILVYLAFRFDFRYAPGAIVALGHDIVMVLGLIAVTWTEFSLPMLAAVLTIAGFSVNDTIVIFDRIREDAGRMRDRKMPAIVNTAVNETLSRTILTSGTVFLTSASIWILGTGVLKPFAMALTFGIVVGTYSSVFIASPVMLAIHSRFSSKKAA